MARTSDPVVFSDAPKPAPKAPAVAKAIGYALPGVGGVLRTMDESARYSPTFDAPMTAAQREAPMVDEDRNDPHGPHDLAAPVPADHGKFSK